MHVSATCLVLCVISAWVASAGFRFVSICLHAFFNVKEKKTYIRRFLVKVLVTLTVSKCNNQSKSQTKFSSNPINLFNILASTVEVE